MAYQRANPNQGTSAGACALFSKAKNSGNDVSISSTLGLGCRLSSGCWFISFGSISTFTASLLSLSAFCWLVIEVQVERSITLIKRLISVRERDPPDPRSFINNSLLWVSYQCVSERQKTVCLLYAIAKVKCFCFSFLYIITDATQHLSSSFHSTHSCKAVLQRIVWGEEGDCSPLSIQHQ